MQPLPDPLRLDERPTRLLVVEDDLSTVLALREFFASAGYQVDCAAGPSDALRLLDRNPYDVVITDLQLTHDRRAEGMVLAGYARRRNPRACVIVLTAYGSEATEQEALRSGVDVYEMKPVELRHLTRCIERVLSHRTCTAAEAPTPGGPAPTFGNRQ